MPDRSTRRRGVRWPQSVRARLTLWYTLVLGAPLVAFAGASFLVLDRALLLQADGFLDEALGAFATELTSEEGEEETAARAIQASLHDVQFRDVRLVVFDSSGGVAAASASAATAMDSTARYATRHPVSLEGIAGRLRAERPTARTTFTLGDGEHAYRVAAQPVVLFGARFIAAAAYPLHGNRETMQRVGVADLVAIPILLLVAAAGGYFLAGRSLSPVAEMTARAAEISATNLNERLPVGPRRDELGSLAVVVNGLLARLEEAFAQQRRFMADASHELRTPVAVLRTEADVTLARPHRTEGEYRESVSVMRDAARRLGRVVDDLFLLARADAGHLPVRRAPLQLEDVVDEAARAVRALAQERGVRVELMPLDDSPFHGDADLLGRLVLNLLDNAIKYSPAGGVVTIALARARREYSIAVTDQGPGIPSGSQAHIFDRFFRAHEVAAPQRPGETSGAGLGLAIGRLIAEAHGGRLELARSDATGSEFRVVLPDGDDDVGDGTLVERSVTTALLGVAGEARFDNGSVAARVHSPDSTGYR